MNDFLRKDDTILCPMGLLLHFALVVLKEILILSRLVYFFRLANQEHLGSINLSIYALANEKAF